MSGIAGPDHEESACIDGHTQTVDAAQRWAEQLDAWKIPTPILDAAPESPWGFPPELFRATDSESIPTRSTVRGIEALPQGGTVIDVGVGAGAGSLPLAARASHITGVDESYDMLAAFDDAAERRGIAHRLVCGSWADVAAEAGEADVVISHHVIYNVPDLAEFCRALDSAAHRRVVLEATQSHPAGGLNDLWQHFHGLDRPAGPTIEDAVAVVEEIGLKPRIEKWTRPERHTHHDRAEVVAFVRRRLCLTRERDEEIDRLLGERVPLRSRSVATLWWDT